MKKILLLTLLTAITTLSFAYQTGSISRPNFSSSNTMGGTEKDKSAVPGQQGVQTRSFTSYGSRQGAWRKGVQTQTVQTQKANERNKDPEVEARDSSMAAIQKATTALTKTTTPQVKSVASTAAKNDPKTAAKKEEPAQPPAAQATPAGMPDMSALTNMMGGAQGGAGGMPDMSAIMNMMGGAGGNSGAGNGAKGGAGGMPDMSAIMNMMGGAGGAKK